MNRIGCNAKFYSFWIRSKDAESHSYEVWKLLLFVWVHGPQEGFGISDFEQETLRNILTVLSPINKAYVCIRLLVLKVSIHLDCNPESM